MVARILLGIAAIVVLACGAVLGGGALWLWTTFGAPEGAVRSLGRIESSAPTIVIDVEQVHARVPFGIPGTVELAFSSESSPLTVVAGETTQVDQLVFGSAYDVAMLDEGTWSTVSVPGVRPPIDPAGTAWPARASGDPAVIQVGSVVPGSLLIVREAAGAGPVLVDLRLTVADARPIALIGMGTAAFVLLVALVLGWAVLFGMRARGRHE